MCRFGDKAFEDILKRGYSVIPIDGSALRTIPGTVFSQAVADQSLVVLPVPPDVGLIDVSTKSGALEISSRAHNSTANLPATSIARIEGCEPEVLHLATIKAFKSPYFFMGILIQSDTLQFMRVYRDWMTPDAMAGAPVFKFWI